MSKLSCRRDRLLHLESRRLLSSCFRGRARRIVPSSPPPVLPHGAPVQISLDDFAIALGTYVVAHYSLVGWNSLDSATPIPAGFPEDMPNMTFLEYLQALGLDVLQNAFT